MVVLPRVMPVARKKSAISGAKYHEIKVDDWYLFQVVVDLRSNANSRRTDTAKRQSLPHRGSEKYGLVVDEFARVSRL